MPIHLDSLDDEADADVTPGTNQAEILQLLYANTELGFTPKEIAGRADINHESVYTALSRLRDRGLIGRSSGGYYHALDDNDEAARIARSLRSPSDIEERYPAPDERRAEGTDTPDSNSPAEPPGSAALSPDEAFALLGNETRVGILQALWAAFESGQGGNVLSFSELFDRVGVRDSGNFSYHLEKLNGPFVRRTEEGYELKQTGINVVRAVVAGTVIDDPAFGPTPVDIACPICDAPVEITYSDEFLKFSCTACEGGRRWNDQPGLLFGALTPPVGVEQRPIEEAYRAAVTYSLHELFAFHNGICPHCSSPPETTVEVCRDHEPGEGTLCPTCDRLHMAVVRMVCTTCKRSIPPPVRLVVLAKPHVTGFYHQHDIEHRFRTWETVVRCFGVGEELVSEDPLRMRFTIPAGSDELRLTLDEDLNVLEVTR